jgi:PAS domain S-box-containing protein
MNQKIELALSANEDFTRSMMDTAAVGMITADEQGLINSYNLMAESMFGYSAAEALGRNVSLLISKPFVDEHQNYLEQIEQIGEKRIVGVGREVTGLRKDGSTFPLRLGVSKFSLHEKNVFTGVLVDITRNKWDAKQLITAKGKAEEAMRIKADFMASMSHELRTPLNGVLGMLELLEHGSLEEKQRNFVKTAFVSAKSLLKIVTGILDFSESEAGQLELDYRKFYARQMFHNCFEPLLIEANKKGLQLEYVLPDELPKFLHGDPLRLTQILSNLTDNAIKFTTQGEINIFVSIAREAEEHVSLRFQVRDTGIGIPKEKYENLFDAFTQEDNSTTRKYGGTGLGLSIAKKLAQLMGGEIGIDNSGQKGASFWFTANFGKSNE